MTKTMKFAQMVRIVRNWPRTLMDHLHITAADDICLLRSGADVVVRGGTDDRHVICEVFIDKCIQLPCRKRT